MSANANTDTTEPQKNNEDSADKKLCWGWRQYKPGYMQTFNTDKWFMVFLLTFNIFQTMNGAFTHSSIPTLEARFKLSSKRTGLIVSANDISGLILLPFVSFFGDTRHKPKWLGIGALVSMMGGLLFILPQAIVDTYSGAQLNVQSLADNATSSHLCFATDSTSDASECAEKEFTNTVVYFIFILARLFMGAGSVPIFSLGISFIDDNANAKHAAVYLGLLFSSIFFSISLAFVIQGILLGTVFIDFTLPEELKGITARDPRWLGNWWIAYTLSSLMLLVSGIMLLGFPRELPGTSERKKKMIETGELRPPDKKVKGGIKGFVIVLLKLLSNATYLTQTVSKLVIAMFWAGVIPFFFKIVQQNYGSNSQGTGLGIALITGPGMAVGIILGSFLSKKLRLKESLQRAAKWCFILQCAGLISTVAWLIPGCDVVTLAGVTKPYLNSSLPIPENILSSCNSACGCNSEFYDPVCGTDGVTYYSPCHAGCLTQNGKIQFANCTCVPPNLPQTAERGVCDRNCTNYLFFVCLYTILLIMAQLNTIPNQVVLLRSIPENYRSLGMGLQPIFKMLLGGLPGPLIFGYFIDNTCLLWLESCGKTGNCLAYEVKDLIMVIFIGGTAVQVISWIFLFISWTLSKRINDEDGSKKRGTSAHREDRTKSLLEHGRENKQRN